MMYLTFYRFCSVAVMGKQSFFVLQIGICSVTEQLKLCYSYISLMKNAKTLYTST